MRSSKWQDHEVLIIDNQAERRHDILVILEFLGEKARQLTAEEWAHSQQQLLDESEKGSHPHVLIVGELPSGLPLEKLLAYVHSVNNAVPVLLIGDDRLPPGIDPELSRHVISQLAFPPSYNKLLDDLHRAQTFYEQFRERRDRGQQRDIELFRSLVGTSRSISSVRKLMTQVSDSDVTVLVTGASGTGKEVVARNLHYHSKRREKPFVPVNCGAIPAELLESELFGHEKGAFTGAISERAGRFEMAQGGTLFLDEIGDMPLNMQVKILRVLQEKTFERVGGNKSIDTDVRIIAATHKNLEEMIEAGTFREDLYYRLNVFPIEMPSLRERSEDIPLLINELVARLEHEKRGSIRFNSAAILSLCQHDWAGNVRELANLVERMAILHPYGVVGVQDLPKKFRHIDVADEDFGQFIGEDAEHATADAARPVDVAAMGFPAVLPLEGMDLKDYMTTLESSLIQQALDDSRGVVARAAERLHIRRTTLVEKMRKYGLHRETATKV